jgi:hypothetical protein
LESGGFWSGRSVLTMDIMTASVENGTLHTVPSI